MEMEDLDKWMVAFIAVLALSIAILVGVYVHAYVTGKRLPGTDQRNEVRIEQNR